MFILLIMLVLVIIFLPYTKEETPVPQKIITCQRHDWVYQDNNQLICSICGMKPGILEFKE